MKIFFFVSKISNSILKILLIIAFLNANLATSQVKPDFSITNGPTLLPGSNASKTIGAKYIYHNVATINVDGKDYVIDAVLTIVDISQSKISYVDKINGVDARFEPETDNTGINGYVEWELKFVFDGTVINANDEGVRVHLKEFTLEAIDVDGDEWFEAVVTNSYTLEDSPTNTTKLAVTQRPDGYTRFSSTGETINGISTDHTEYIVRIDYKDVDVINFRNGRVGRGNRLHSLGFQREVIFDLEKVISINQAPRVTDKISSALIQDTETFTTDLFQGAEDDDGNIDKLTMHIVDPNNEANQGGLGLPLVIPGEGTYVLTDVPNQGMNVTYSPEQGFHGMASIIFFVDDDLGVSSNRATFSVLVNDTPIATNDTISGNEDSIITANIITGDNGNGPDTTGNGTLEIESFTLDGDATIYSPGNTVALSGKGAVNLESDGTFTFIPLNGETFNGTLPEITYKLIDNEGGSSSATVNVTINSINQAPIALGHTTETELGINAKLTATHNDYDPDGTIDNSTVDLDPSTPGLQKTFVKNGTWTVDNHGLVTFTPSTIGTTIIDYTVNDNNGATSNVAQLTVIVNPANDADGDGINDKFDLDSDNDGILNTEEGFASVTPQNPRSTYSSTTRVVAASGPSIPTPTTGYVVTDKSSLGKFAFEAVSKSETGSGTGIGTISYVTIDVNFAPLEYVNNVQVNFKIGSQSSPTGNGYFDEGFYIEINGTVVVNFNYLAYNSVTAFNDKFDINGGGWAPWNGEGNPELVLDLQGKTVKLLADTKSGTREDALPLMKAGAKPNPMPTVDFEAGVTIGTAFNNESGPGGIGYQVLNFSADVKTHRDSDGDGIFDFISIDTDNDGCFDVNEVYGIGIDTNGNGQYGASPTRANGGVNSNGLVIAAGVNSNGTAYTTLQVDNDTNGEEDYTQVSKTLNQISAEPLDVTSSIDNAAVFTLDFDTTGSGTEPIIQWYAKKGGSGTETALSDGTSNGLSITGATSKNLTLTGLLSTNSGDTFYAKITSPSLACDTDLQTREASLTVSPHDLIATPDVLTIVRGKSSTLSATGIHENDLLLGATPIIDGAQKNATLSAVIPVGVNLGFDPITGKITVNSNTPIGSYIVNYTICEDADPTNCASGTATIEVIADTDYDGVPDITDLDDDNDGILDSEEGTCSLPNQMRLGYITDSRDLDSDRGYTLDGNYMKNSLLQKIQNPANFGPNGTVSTEIILIPISSTVSEASLNSLNIDALFIGGIDRIPTIQSWISDAEIAEIQQWSLQPNKSVIITQATATKWGRQLTPTNRNPDSPNDAGRNTSIFDGPFGKVSNFNQGGSYQAVFTADTSKNDIVLAVDSNRERVLIKDGTYNDILISDVDILTTIGGVSNGGGISNDNDRLALNLIFTVIPLSACPETDLDLDKLSNSLDLDSDGDTCFDVVEVYGASADPDNDGIFGSGTPVVDANGLVVAAGISGNSYTTSPTDINNDGTPEYRQASQLLTGIQTQPVNQNNILISQTATFSAAPSTSGTGISSEIKWQVKIPGGTFTDIMDDANYSGSSTRTLSITNLNSSFDNYHYRAIFSSATMSCDQDYPTNNAILTIQKNPIVLNDVTLVHPSTETGVLEPNILSGDQVNGVPANNTNSILTIIGSLPSGISIDTTTGALSSNGSLTPGNYTINYQLCESANPTNCESATITLTILVDSDMDGIADLNDLDDDNDGILDTVEGAKSTTVGTAFSSGSGTGNVTGTLSSLSGSIVYDISFQNSGNTANGGTGNASEFFNSGTEISCASTPSGEQNSFIFTPQGTAMLSDLEEVIVDVSWVNDGESLTFSQPLTDFTLKSGTTGNLSSNGLTVTIITGNNSSSAGFTAKLNSAFVNPFVITGTLASADTFTVKVAASIFDRPDADNDGIPNQLDLDSDNDGCSDTQEVYTSTTDFGPNPIVDSNGLITAAGVSGSDYTNLPSDNDTNGTDDYLQASKSLVSISVQPTDHVTNINKPVTFSVVPTTSGNGTEISYQWQVYVVSSGTWTNISDDVNYSGTNTDKLTITPSSTAFNGNIYRVQLSTPSYNCDTDLTSLEPILLINSNAINANNDAVTVVERVAGVNIVNVITNDQLDHSSVSISDITLTQISSSVSGLTLDTATGNVNIDNTVTEGIYFLDYQICENVDPTNCSVANVTVVVQKDTDGDGIPDATDTDIDGDGNGNSTDPNPNTPTANNENVNVKIGQANIIDLLANDDFEPGANTSITQTGGTATGTVSLNNNTGELTYTPTLAEAGTTVTVVYRVENTPTGVSDTATVNLIVEDEADLRLSVTLDNATPNVGDTVTFTLTLNNDGPSNASNIDVSALLPDGYSYISGTPSQGSYNDTNGNWFVGNITNGGNSTLTISALVNPNGSYTFNAEIAFVDQNDPDSTPGNGNPAEDDFSTTASTPVAQADLLTIITVDNSTPNEGDDITYQIKVTNNGPSTASNVELTFTLASGVTFKSDDSAGSYNPTTGKWTIGNLNQGQSVFLHIVATVDSGEAGNTIPGTISQVATGIENDANSASDLIAAPITVNNAALTTTTSIDNTTPNEGDTIKFTIALSNAGPNSATGILLTSVLPAGLTYISDNGGGTYNSATGIWTPSDLSSGGNSSIEITAQVDSGTAGSSIGIPVSSIITDQTTSNTIPSIVSLTVKSIDLVTTITVDNSTPNEGETIKYTIQITNNGPSTATNVSITNLLPTGVSYSSDNSGGSYNSGTGVWSVGTLANAANSSLEITAIVDPGTAGNHITSTISAVSSTETDTVSTGDILTNTISVSSINLVTTIGVGNSTPNVNAPNTIIINVTNNSLGTATGVSLTCLIPSELSYVSNVASQGTYTPGSGIWDIGSIPAGTTVNLVLNITANSDQGGQTINISTTAAIGDQTDPTTTGDLLSATISPTSANLITNFSVDNPTPDEGSTVTFTIRVRNAGPSNETNVSITTDSWPLSGLTYVSDDSLGSYNPATGLWNIGNLASGATITLNISATVNTATGGNTYTFESSSPASGDQTDLTTTGDNLSTSITVQSAKLSTSISVDNTLPNEGDTVNYTITVINNGPSTDNNISLTSLIPAGLTFISSSPTQGSYNNGSGEWTIGTLINGAKATLTLVTTVDAGQSGQTIISSTSPALGNHTNGSVINPNLSTSITVSEVNLVTTKYVDNTSPNEGGTIEYSLTVSNTSPIDATNVSLTDNLPLGITYVSSSASSGSYNNGTGIWTIGTISANTNETLNIVATINGGTLGNVITNTTSAATADQGDTSTAGDKLNASLIVTDGDLITTKFVNNPAPNEGETISYTINVINNSTLDDTNISLIDLLPSGVTYVSEIISQGTYTPGTGVWDIGGLTAGSKAQLVINATVDAGTGGSTITNTTTAASGDQVDPTSVGDILNAEIIVTSANLVTTIKVDNPNPNEGDLVNYTIHVVNNGPNDETNVSLEDHLPAGVTFVSATPSTGSYSNITGVWTIGNIAKYNSVNLVLSGTIDAGNNGQTITNTIVQRANGDQADPTTSGDILSSDLVVSSADLVTTINVDNPTPNEGDAVIYSLIVRNNGPNDESNVELTSLLPNGVSFISATPTSGSYAQGTGIWSIGNLAANTTATLLLVGTIDSGASLLGTITTTTTAASGNIADSNPLGDNLSVAINVTQSDLITTISSNNPTPNENDTVTLTIVVANNGPNTETNASLTSALPAGLTYISDNSGGSYNHATGLWQIGTILKGDSKTLSINASVNSDTGGSVINVITTAANGDQADPNNSTDTLSTVLTIGNAADIVLSKIVDNSSPNEGDIINYTISVTNNGPTNVTDLVITDVLPAGLTFVQEFSGIGVWDTGASTWSIATLPAGESRNLILQASVDPGTGGSTITNSISNTQNQVDSNVSPDDFSETIQVTQVDLFTEKSVNNITPNEGDIVTYIIKVTNASGSDPATNVVLTDVLPVGVSYISDNGNGAYNNGSGLWNIGSLAEGSSKTLLIDASINVGTGGSTIINTTSYAIADQADSNTTPDVLSASLTVTSTDLVTTKTVDITTPTEGQNIIYTLLVENNAGNDATGVSLIDRLPTGVTYLSDDSGGNYNATSGVWTIGDIAASTSKTINITATVDAGTANTTITNTTSEAQGNQSDPTTVGDNLSASISVISSDLVTVKTVNTSQANVGEIIVYTLSVTNNGPSNATNVVLTDNLPSEVTYLSDDSGGSFNSVSGVWNIGNLANGANETINISATVNPSGAGKTVTNALAAPASGTEVDPSTSNDVLFAAFDVISNDLSALLVVDKTTPNEGDLVTYTLTVSNNGPSEATNVSIIENLPPGITYVSHTTLEGTYNFGAGIWSIGSLAKGASATLTLVGSINIGIGGQTLVNTTSAVSSDFNDPDNSNNSSSVSITIGNSADIVLTNIVDNNLPNEGDTVTFTITASNNGPARVTNLIIENTLPSGLSYQLVTPGVGTWTAPNWNIGTLESGSSTTLTIQAIVDNNTGGQSLTNVVSNNQTQTDTNLSIDDFIETLTVTSANLITSKTVSNNTPNEGETIVYTISVENNGPNDATGVSLTDVLPNGVTYISDNGAGAFNSGSGLWTVGNIANGATSKLDITVLVNPGTGGSTIVNNVSRAIGDQSDNTTNGDDLNEAITITNSELVTSISVNNATPAEGEIINYSIRVNNQGPNDATGVYLTTLIPSDLTFDNAVVPAGTTFNSGSGIWDIGNIPSQTSVILNLFAIVNPGTGGLTIINQTTAATGDQSDPDLISDSLSVPIVVSNESDIVITKVVDNNTPNVGDIITYTITVENRSGAQVKNFILSDVLPNGLSVNNATVTAGVWASPYWSIPTLSVNQIETLIVSVHVNDGTGGLNLTNTVVHSQDQTDSNISSDDLIETISVTDADLVTVISVDNSNPNEGDTVRFLIEVTNNGSSDATGVSLVNNLPNGISFSPAIVSQGSFNSGSGIWNIGTILNGTSATLTIDGVINSGTGGSTITNTTSAATGDQSDPTNSGDILTALINVTSSNLLTSISVDNDTPNEGDTIVYTIDVTNLGNDTATNVSLTSILPAGLTFVSDDGNGSYNPNSGIWNIGTVANGANTSINISATVDSGTGGTAITNTTTAASGDQSDPTIAGDILSTTIYVTSSDLIATISVDNSNPNEGDQVTYTITVFNNGPNDASNVILTNFIPTDLTYISDDGAGSFNQNTTIWTIGTIPTGNTRELKIIMSINPGTGGTIITNSISSAISDQSDPSSNGDILSVDLTVTSSDLVTVKTVTTNAINGNTFEGEIVTYDITVTNNGPSDATNVGLTDNLPVGVTYVNHVADTGVYNIGSGHWSIGSIQAGTTVDLKIYARVDSGTGGTIITNTTTKAIGDQSDPTDNLNELSTDLIVSNNSDILITKVVDNNQPNEGDEITFSITATNKGPTMVTNFVVTDVLPQGLTYVMGTPSTGLWSSPDWNIGSLASGSSATLTLKASVDSGTGGLTIVNSVSKTHDQIDIDTTIDDLDESITISSAELVTTKIATSSGIEIQQVNEGDIVTYEITVENIGPSDASNVQLTDILPSSVTYISDDSNGMFNHGSGIWTIGSLINGASETLKIDVSVNSNTSGQIIVNTTGAARGDQSDPNNIVDDLDASFEVKSESDIQLTKTVDNPKPNEGEVVTFTVTVSNNSGATATNLVITDILPSGLIYGVVTPSTGSWNAPNWNIASLAPGNTEIITIQAGVEFGTQGLTLVNTVTNSQDQLDTNISLDDPSETIQVTSSDLSVTKTVNNPAPNEGSVITYTITVENLGPDHATGVYITDILPPEITYVGHTASIGDYNQGSGLWDIGAIPNTDKAVLTINATVNSGTKNTPITNTTSTVRADQADPDQTNNMASVTIVPQFEIDLSISKNILGNNSTNKVGDIINYEIIIENTGPNTATGVEVLEKLPSGLEFVKYTSSDPYDSTSGIWTISSIESNTSKILFIDAKVLASGDYNNCVEIISADQIDIDSTPGNGDTTEDDYACISINPDNESDLELNLEVNNDEPFVNDLVEFTINVLNQGPSEATGVEINALLPSGFEFFNANSTSGTYDEISGIWSINPVGINSIETLVITASVKNTGDWLFKVEVSASDIPDPDSTPNNSNISEDDYGEVKVRPKIILKIPETFSPNGDGINETFEIPNLHVLYPNFRIEIVNRYGYNVFEYKHNGNPGNEPIWWDGSSSGKLNIGSGILPAGTYFYTIYFNDNNRKPQTGWVYLRK